mgnify:CR=1 FL=1|jgi:hypothetical protein
MRRFTKTHNDLKWLFPVAKTKKEAEEKFEDVEEQAKYLAENAGIDEKDKDLAIDCFMKGYSQALQLEFDAVISKYVGNIYKNLLKLKKNYLDNEKEQKKWFQLYKFEELIKYLAYNRPESEHMEKCRKYLVDLLKNSGFNVDGPIEERKKLYRDIK